ncbi:hypothetical protein MRB53_040891 [Persea americana]|nr:hypothetical protein MRB53_040891 [Persea americana]
MEDNMEHLALRDDERQRHYPSSAIWIAKSLLAKLFCLGVFGIWIYSHHHHLAAHLPASAPIIASKRAGSEVDVDAEPQGDTNHSMTQAGPAPGKTTFHKLPLRMYGEASEEIVHKMTPGPHLTTYFSRLPFSQQSTITNKMVFTLALGLLSLVDAKALVKRAGTTVSTSVRNSGLAANIGTVGSTTTVNAGVTEWLSGAGPHNIFGNVNNYGNIILSQTDSFLPVVPGMASAWTLDGIRRKFAEQCRCIDPPERCQLLWTLIGCVCLESRKFLQCWSTNNYGVTNKWANAIQTPEYHFW